MSLLTVFSERTSPRCLLTLFVIGLLLLGGGRAEAQMSPRIGGGLQMMGSTVLQSAGPGLHLRTSFPMNRDFSLAVGGTVTGFFKENAPAAYALSPEASLIVTMPNPSSRSLYFLGGGGAHIPVGDERYDADNVAGDENVVAGPTFHLGFGWVWQQTSTSLYVEVAPTLFFRLDRTEGTLPVRGGIIF